MSARACASACSVLARSLAPANTQNIQSISAHVIQLPRFGKMEMLNYLNCFECFYVTIY